MARIIHIGSHVIFQKGRVKVTIRDSMMALAAVVVLLVALTRCEEGTRIKQLEALENVCGFTTNNGQQLVALLGRSDLCSEAWNQDYADYMTRMQEQNTLLKESNSQVLQEIYGLQKELWEALEGFKKQPKEEALLVLQEKTEAYQAYDAEECQGEVGRR